MFKWFGCETNPIKMRDEINRNKGMVCSEESSREGIPKPIGKAYKLNWEKSEEKWL